MDTIIVNVPRGQSHRHFRVGTGANRTFIISIINKHSVDASVTVSLEGKGANATIIGIVVGKENDRVSLHTLQLHKTPETTSNLLIKTVLGGEAQCYFDGAIRVERQAQKTDAYQRNENLLLSSAAKAESKPSLEILANDVRCTHGATVGPVSPEQVWYLGSRGISSGGAESLIVKGFLGNALERIDNSKVREQLTDRIVHAV